MCSQVGTLKPRCDATFGALPRKQIEHLHRKDLVVGIGRKRGAGANRPSSRSCGGHHHQFTCMLVDRPHAAKCAIMQLTELVRSDRIRLHFRIRLHVYTVVLRLHMEWNLVGVPNVRKQMWHLASSNSVSLYFGSQRKQDVLPQSKMALSFAVRSTGALWCRFGHSPELTVANRHLSTSAYPLLSASDHFVMRDSTAM